MSRSLLLFPKSPIQGETRTADGEVTVLIVSSKVHSIAFPPVPWTAFYDKEAGWTGAECRASKSFGNRQPTTG